MKTRTQSEKIVTKGLSVYQLYRKSEKGYALIAYGKDASKLREYASTHKIAGTSFHMTARWNLN